MSEPVLLFIAVNTLVFFTFFIVGYLSGGGYRRGWSGRSTTGPAPYTCLGLGKDREREDA